MGKMRSLFVLAIVTVCIVFGVAWAKGDWSSAKSKVEEFKSQQQELKKMTPEETKRIVTAICEADEDQRKQAGRDIADRVARDVGSKVLSVERMRDDAYKLLDDVISDQDLSGNHSDAKSMRDDVKTRWESIEKMTRRLRGANHPVVSYMVDQGNRAHVDRQSSCDAKEISLSSGRFDCAMASGETCVVIELKPDNSNAINKGRDQYGRYVRELNDELKKPDSSIIKKLIDADRDFSTCKRFEGRVDCYKLCPSISEDGDSSEPSANWRKDC